MMHPSLTACPQAGDIVLTRVTDGSQRYALATSERLPQITYASYEEAAEEAQRLAQAHGLDVWQTDDACVFSRILECRPQNAA